MKYEAKMRYCNRLLILLALLSLCWAQTIPAIMAQDEKDKPAESATPDDATATDDEKKPTSAEKVTGKLVVANDDKIVVDFAKAEFVLEEEFQPGPPPLPEKWDDMSPEEQQKWAEEFLQSEAGKKYQAEQEALFEKRQQLKIIVNDQGEFSLKDVSYGLYLLRGVLQGKKGERKYRADVYASIEVGSGVGEVLLGEIEVELFPLLEVGDVAPDFELELLSSGEKISLSKFRGKYVLIDFWATWCGPCVRATPDIQKAYEKFGADGKLEVIGVSLDDEKEPAQEYTLAKKIKWVQAFAGPDDNPAVIDFGVQGIPSFWLIDPDGKIAATSDDFFDAELDFEKVLQKKLNADSGK
jgi:thiol-disulfide isomerase/thioredoxin